MTFLEEAGYKDSPEARRNWQLLGSSVKVRVVQYPKAGTVVSRVVKIVKGVSHSRKD